MQAEASQFGDILRLDSTDTYADLSSKTVKLFSKLPGKFRADFYFKVDDDTIVNVPALVAYLEPRRQHGNLYMVRSHNVHVVRVTSSQDTSNVLQYRSRPGDSCALYTICNADMALLKR